MNQRILSDLNGEQRRAVESASPVIIINAGPGTGKTKTLISRISYLILEKHVDPSSILAITFTKKAAAEMKERLHQVISGKKMPYISTFHSFAFDILSQEKVIHLVDNRKRKEIIENLLKSNVFAGINKKDADRTISLYKSSSRKRSDSPTKFDTVREKFVLDYNKSLKSQNLFDYDDILLEFYELLQIPEKLQSLQNRFTYILVDEFQDTNEVQYEIIKKLFNQSLFIIGDPNQSIYSFRGAGKKMFDQVNADFPEACIITLPTNYRSSKHIVHVSSLLFQQKFNLSAYRLLNGSVHLISVLDEYAEADFIIRTIGKLVGGTDLLHAETIADHTNTVCFSDFAVIYRNHRISNIIQEKLFNSGMPYQVIGDNNPYEQREIKFIIDCLQFIYHRTDQTILKMADYPFIKGQEQIKGFLEQLDSKAKLSILIHKLVQQFGLLERIKDNREEERNLMQFQNTMSRFDTNTDGIIKAIEYVNYLNEHEYYEPYSDKVTLLTMHASKGLEFKVVFICGFEDGIIPSKRFDSDQEEEKRLLYVAMTRAKDSLYLTSTQKRDRKPAIVSSFKKLITCEELIEMDDDATAQVKKRVEKIKIKKSQMKMF